MTLKFLSSTFNSCIFLNAGEVIGGELLKAVSAKLPSTWPGFPASKCIDGDTSTWYNMCHTKGQSHETRPWLAIDYGTSVTVERVKIFNRDDCCGDRTRNVEVRISNELPTSSSQMFSGGSLLGTFPGPAINGQNFEISGEKGFLLTLIC